MKILDFLSIFTICFLLGLDFILAKQALEVLNPLFFTSVRFFIVGFALFPFIKKQIPKHLKELFFAGIMMVLVQYGANDLSNKLNSSTMVAGVLGQFDAILAIFIGYLIFKEKITKNAIIGLSLTIIGLIGMSVLNIFFLEKEANSFSQLGVNWKNVFSIAIIIFGLTGWAGYLFFAKKIENKINAIEIVAWSSLLGAFSCLLVSLLFENPIETIENLKKIDKKILFRMIYSGIFGILVPDLLFFL